MKALTILFAVLLIIVLLGQIRVGVRANYSQEGIGVWVRFGAFKLQILPVRKKEQKKTENKKKEKPAKKTAKKPQEEKNLPERIGGALEYAQALLPVLLDAVKSFYRKLQVDTLLLELTAGSSDPADTAMLYGQANAALGAIWHPLTQALHVKDGTARVNLDFDAPAMTLYADASLSLKIGQVFYFGIYFGLRALKRFLAVRKHQKLEAKQRKAV